MPPKTWKKLCKPEIFFPLIILLTGLVFILITPIGANFDEETYMARIFEMSLGHIMPNSFLGEGRNYPAVLMSNSYRQDVNLWPVDAPSWIEQAKVRIDWNNRDFDSLWNYRTRAVYFPTLFILQAPIMRIMGPRLDIPIVFIFYAIRFSYLLIYFLLVFLALRIIPFGKWILGTIAIAPMSLILASAVSPDPIIFGVCFLFVAWILYLIKQSDVYISKKQLLITCGLILAVCALKPNYFFILFLLFALPYKNFLKKSDLVAIVLVCLVGIGMSLGWTYMASQVVFNQLNMASDSMPNFTSLFQAPQIFIKSLTATISKSIIPYLIQAIGISGYDYWRLPGFVYFLYPITLVLVFFLDENKNILTRKQKIVFWLTGIINFLVVFTLFFVANTPLNSPTIVGVHGRYLIPFFLLLILPFVFAKPVNNLRLIVYGFIGLILLASTTALFLDYHVICGESLTSQKACRLPYYKNWGPETFLSASLAKGSVISQNIIVDCETISHIEVWPLLSEVENHAQAAVNLRTGSGDILATSTFSPSGIVVNKWYSIDIPDVVGLKGSSITIEILPTEGQDLSKFELGVFPTDEYTKGELFIKDGITSQSYSDGNDLIFKYQCEKPYTR